MKKHPFNDVLTDDIDIKNVPQNTVGSLHATAHTVLYHIIYIFIIYNNNVMMVISSRIRASVDDDLADVQFFVHLVSLCSASDAEFLPTITSVLSIHLATL